MEYFVIGESELVTGFSLAGVNGQAVFNRHDALEVFQKMTGQSSSVNSITQDVKPKILIITEDVADMIQQEILDWLMKGETPLVVEIPGLNGHIEGRKTLTDAIREAVGIQI